MHSLLKKMAALFAVMAAAAALAACGSDSSSDEATTKSSTTEETEATAPGLQEAKEIVAELSERPTSIGVEEPITEPIPEGKTIDFIQCSVPSCVTLGGNLEEAAEVLGWKLNRINAGLSPETVKAAYAEAVRRKPDGVIGTGFPREVFERELQQLKDAGIPVIELATTDEAGDGITAVLNSVDAVKQDGKDRAAWIVADSEGKANTLTIDTGTFPTVGIEFEEFAKEYERLCPDCVLDELTVPAESIGKDLPTRIVGHMRQNPDINYIAVGFNDMAIGLPAALRNAGLDKDVTIVARDSSPTIAQYLEKGEIGSIVGVAWPESMWQAMDVFARIFTDQPIEPSVEAPQARWLITQGQVPSTSETFPLVEDYKEQFTELWGK